MEPTIGWTVLSRAALKRAETYLSEASDGVRDEIGFLAIHQAYANRFFPGTSVLQTRLRYVLFIPWIYEKVAAAQGRGPGLRGIAGTVEREELQLVYRLRQSAQWGVIGGDTYPRAVVQPASMIYWSALGRWRVLRPVAGGEAPSRAAVHRYLGRRRATTNLLDDDKDPLETEVALFRKVPGPPKEWGDPGAKLDFGLREVERDWVRGLLVGVERHVDRKESLLGRLAGARVEVPDELSLWDPAIAEVADAGDRAALERARQTAALVAIGRAVYAGLTEIARERDGVATPDKHRVAFERVVAEYREQALRLDVAAVIEDEPRLVGNRILTVMGETHRWLAGGGGLRTLEDLRPLYAEAELARKGRRARLPEMNWAQKRRAEWESERHPEGYPVGFRWFKVSGLLRDLNGGGG